MKKFNFLAALILLLSAGNAVVAQDQASDEDYLTDENLRRYAMIMEIKDGMVAEISDVTNEMIKEQEGMDGKRYMELSKGEGEPAKEYEQKFMDAVEKMKNERVEDIKTVNQILATKLLPDGGRAYKAIKSALQSNEEVKARYQKIEAQLKLQDEGENGDS